MAIDGRQLRGMELAVTKRIKKAGAAWIVPSQTTRGSKYAVTRVNEGYRCNCPDFELRGLPCKHTYAVQYSLFRETAQVGRRTLKNLALGSLIGAVSLLLAAGLAAVTRGISFSFNSSPAATIGKTVRVVR